jgi:hypothetical protein
MACVACYKGPRRPNIFLQEANVSLEGDNVTVKGHDVFIFD